MAARNQVWRLGPLRPGRRPLGPNQEGRLPQGFTWGASVDRITGTAAAQEISHFRATATTTGNGRNNPRSGAAALLAQTSSTLGRYPQWLCRASVTLGLLRVREEIASGAGATYGATSIQTRLGGIDLLTFDKPVGQRVSVNTRDKASSRSLLQQEAVQWKYPITGGVLASRPGGALVVTLRQQQQPFVTSPSSSSSMDLVLDTQLVDYRPRLVGGAVAASTTTTTTTRRGTNPLRVGFYLGTQSLLHGYVMWRFHRYVRSHYQRK